MSLSCRARFFPSKWGEIGCEVTALADLNDLSPEGINTPVGLAVHPFTGELYVSHQIGFTFPPPGEIADADLVKSGISILHPDGTLESVLPDGVLLNSMLFEALPLPVSGTQGCDFDHAGNLYCAQGINDKSRERWHLCEGFDDGSDECDGASDSDEWQSGIIKVAADGTVSLWSSGHRSPYDVVVGMEDKKGVAQIIFAGDNGEGEECDVGDGVVGPNEVVCIEDNGSKPTIQLYDELNSATEGSFHGFPEGYPPLAVPQDEWKIPETHSGAVWNLGKHPYPDPNNPDTLPNTPIQFYDWPVPTGIDYDERSWGGLKNAVYMALYNCTSTAFDDLGTVEVFHGPNLRKHTVLLWNLDGPIDLRMSRDGDLYVLQFSDGAIFKVEPE